MNWLMACIIHSLDFKRFIYIELTCGGGGISVQTIQKYPNVPRSVSSAM